MGEVQKGVTTLPPLEALMPPSLKAQDIENELEKEASLRKQRLCYPVLGRYLATWAGGSRSPSPKSPILLPHVTSDNGGMSLSNAGELPPIYLYTTLKTSSIIILHMKQN